MAVALDRNTGRPVRGSAYEDQSSAQQQTTVTGPRTDFSTVSSQERAAQNVSSYQSARNTTPTVLAILDQFVQQLFGAPAVSASEAEQKVPLLVREMVGGRAPGDFSPGHRAEEVWRDPATGRVYRGADAAEENARRLEQRKQLVAKGTVPSGTPEQQQQQTERQREIERNRAAQGTYSKDAAFADAQSLVNKSIQDALEKAMPAIFAASEGAGTSRSSMGALLAQRAAERGAVEGAALGTQTAVAYGGIQNQLAGILELLTRSDPNSPANLLLQTIAASKGLVSEQSGNQDTSSISQKQQTGATEVGSQNVIQNALKEILEPLTQLNTLTKSAAPQEVRPRATGLVSRNEQPTSTLDQTYEQYITPSEVSVYSSSGEEY